MIAILDTNCDPDEVQYPIPGNDDAIRSVGLLTRIIADAAAEGLIQRHQKSEDDGAPAEPLAAWEAELLAGEATGRRGRQCRRRSSADATEAAEPPPRRPLPSAAAEAAAETVSAAAAAETRRAAAEAAPPPPRRSAAAHPKPPQRKRSK